MSRPQFIRAQVERILATAPLDLYGGGGMILESSLAGAKCAAFPSVFVVLKNRKLIRFFFGFLVITLGMPAFVILEAQTTPPPSAPVYLNASLPIDVRIQDLLLRMTLQEKVGQLEAPLGWMMYRKQADGIEVSEKFEKLIGEYEPGTLYGVLRADPWTKVTLSTGLSARESAEAMNALQRFAISHSRLHIPLLLAEECSHGHMAIGSTVFPTAIGQASTWDPELINRLAEAVAEETRASGGNLCYGPILDIAREPRWSRVEETYGEDPFLTTQMGVAFVHGLQGGDLSHRDTIAATLKHFAGYGQPQGGHNGGPTEIGPREVQSVFLPPFKAGIEAGAVSVMSSYNAIDGLPSTANPWLLNDVLRRQWDFKGFVVSDLGAIDGLVQPHHIAANLEEAATLALNSGVDSDLGASAYPRLVQEVEGGRLSLTVLDRAVERVLRVKMQLGLFDSPYVDPEHAEKVIGSEEHKAIARQVAHESIILLKNSGNLLPLRKDIPSIAVIGPNADNVYNQLGDYTAPQPEGKAVTVLQGIRGTVGNRTIVRYARGTSIRGTSKAEFAAALDAVRQSSVAVVVLGGSSARNFNTLFANTGAAKPEMDATGSDMESGEGFDRATLQLAGVQEELLKQIVQTGKPVVLVMIDGRPLELNWANENIPAILEAWYPGELGGAAVSDILFGDYNPGGKLPISVPRSTGQLPVFYSQTNPNYVDMAASPLFPFGYGLSYSSFEYRNAQAKVVTGGGNVRVEVSVDVTNKGQREGDEVVQLYLHQFTASVVPPAKVLKGFRRIHLQPGETQTIPFSLMAKDLAIFGREGKWTVEPGPFEAIIGGSSDATLRTGTFFLPHTASE